MMITVKTIKHSYVWALSLIYIVLSSSCDLEKWKQRQVVKEMNGREIIFPNSLDFRIADIPIKFDIVGADYKIVTFLDSLDCIPCNLRLKDWKSLIDDYDKFPDVDVDFIMILNDSEWERTTKMLKTASFPFVVARDCEKIFKNINKLPENSDYHTFMLNYDNEVVALGNPIKNPKVRNLYHNILMKSSDEIKNMQSEEIDIPPSHALGVINPKDSFQYVFRFMNTTNKEMIVQDIIPSCDCVNATMSSTKLNPREAVDVHVVFGDTNLGHFRRYVDVFFEDKEKPVRLKFQGYVSQ